VNLEANNWAQSSITSKVDNVWNNAVGDLPKGAPRFEIISEYDEVNDEFVIDYRFGPHIRV
jgi:hypothetical protein